MSLEAAEHFLLKANHSMFRPLEQDDKGRWRFYCTALDEDGRCTIYEQRPQLCRDYKPGTDPLCVHHVEKTPVDSSVVDVIYQERHSNTGA